MSLKQKTGMAPPSLGQPLPSSSEPLESLDWLSLPRELTGTIFSMLGQVETLVTAQRVCTAWRSICKHPSMWRSIDMRNAGDKHGIGYDLEAMCLHAVNLSQGSLEDIKIEDFGNDPLLINIAARSSKLRCLRFVCCYNISDDGLKEAIAKFPLLDHLEISYCSFSEEALKAVGRSCPLLKTLKFNRQGFKHPHFESDDDALAIAQNIPALRYLQIFGNKLTDKGLHAILDGCPHLEYLDLRQCFNVKLVENLKKRCSEQIKDLRQPNDLTDDYEFDATIQDMFSSDEDYPYGFSDINLMSDDDYDNYFEFSGDSDFSDYEFMGFD